MTRGGVQDAAREHNNVKTLIVSRARGGRFASTLPRPYPRLEQGHENHGHIIDQNQAGASAPAA